MLSGYWHGHIRNRLDRKTDNRRWCNVTAAMTAADFGDVADGYVSDEETSWWFGAFQLGISGYAIGLNVQRCNYHCTLRRWLKRIHWGSNLRLILMFITDKLCVLCKDAVDCQDCVASVIGEIWSWSLGDVLVTGKYRSIGGRTRPTATLFTIMFTWFGRGLNPSRLRTKNNDGFLQRTSQLT